MPRERVHYRCSFCDKSQEQVHRLIAGPSGVYICDECIDLCQEILTEKQDTGVREGLQWESTAQPEVLDPEPPPHCVFCHQPVDPAELWAITLMRCEDFVVRDTYYWDCHDACLRQWKPPSVGQGFGMQAQDTTQSDGAFGVTEPDHQ